MINDIAKEIAKAMKDYTDDVKEGIEQEINETAKNIVKDLKSSSPKETGDYGKGWSQKNFKSGTGYEKVVHNRTDYQLTHLLEKGHQNRDGGRTQGKEHIESGGR